MLRSFAAAMRRCKQGAMRKILKYAAIVLVLLLVAAGIAFYVMSRPDAAHFSTAELSGRVPVMAAQRSEEHTSELQSLMRNSYAVFCLNKKTTHLTLTNILTDYNY